LSNNPDADSEFGQSLRRRPKDYGPLSAGWLGEKFDASRMRSLLANGVI
jgi:hypothetical protein